MTAAGGAAVTELAQFLADHSRVQLDVRLLDRDFNLVEAGIDLAVRIGPLRDSRLIVRRLGSLLWVVGGAPDYPQRRSEPRSPEAVRQHDCLVFSQPGYEWQFRQDGRTGSVQGAVRMRANTLDAVVAAAVAGAGLVYAPAWQVREHVAAGRLRVVLRDYELAPLPINAMLSHSRLLSTKVRRLLDFLAGALSSGDFTSVA